MEKINVIKNVIFLPKIFYGKGNISMDILLRQSGYFEINHQIEESDILELLNKYPECINQWSEYSDDKRTSSGWYFKKNDSGKYVVGYYPASEKLKAIEYLDKAEACAAFIKREIEAARNLNR